MQAPNDAPADPPTAAAQNSPAPVANPPSAAGAPGPTAAPIAQQQPRPAERVPTRKLIAGADDEIPADADLIEMPPSALRSRLDRFTKKQLRDAFGTDDISSIKASLDEHQRLKAEAEQRRLAEMTETDRLREQLAMAERDRDAALERAERVQTERVVAEQDHVVMGILRQHINPRYVKHEARNLAEHIASLSDAELADPEAAIVAWCRQAVQEDPALSLPQAEAAPQAAPPPPAPGTTAARPPVPVPITNGAAAQRPMNVVPNGVQGPPQTFAPGRANSASDAEWRNLKRANGWNF